MKVFLLLLSFVPVFGMACESRGPNVILFTVDGVRNKEFFTTQHFPKFWRKHADRGMVQGFGGTYTIASRVAISLPSYQAMLTGGPTSCLNNKCGRVNKPSVFESVRETLNLKKKDVAVVASWEKISLALAKPDSITAAIFPDRIAGHVEIQDLGQNDLPRWKGSRKDEHTFELGMQYLQTQCPRLLFLSLVDADEEAHDRNFEGYLSAIHRYDSYLDRLLKILENLGDYGRNTTVLFTTDHSRGRGKLWPTHGLTPFTNKRVFFYAVGRNIPALGVVADPGGHSEIKPLIESLVGIVPGPSRQMAGKF
jgi:hypothetical protein